MILHVVEFDESLCKEEVAWISISCTVCSVHWIYRAEIGRAIWHVQDMEWKFDGYEEELHMPYYTAVDKVYMMHHIRCI